MYHLLYIAFKQITCDIKHNVLTLILTVSSYREVYHTKRMQRVVCVKWSLDDRYILSGSDEMNIRLWKANASEKLGMVRIICSMQMGIST